MIAKIFSKEISLKSFMLNISDSKKQISLKFIKKIMFTLQIKSCNIFAQIEIKQKNCQFG